MNVIEKSGQAAAPSADSAALPADHVPGSNAELAALAERFKQLLANTTPSTANTNGTSTPVARSASSHTGQQPSRSPAEAVTLSSPGFLSRHETVLEPSPASAIIQPTVLHAAGDEPAPAIIPRATRDSSESPLSRHDPASSEESDPLSAPETPGAAMLQSFLSQSSTIGGPTPLAPAARVQSLESVVAETVSRVLVSDPLHDGRREVRIEFARDILPDTEVRLWRDAGRLHVEFISAPAVAEHGLKEALPRLGDAIQQRHPETTTPVVTLRLHDLDAGSHHGDGRSRQRYQRPDESEELA